MNRSDIDAMIAAQRVYEARRSKVYNGVEHTPDEIYQFVTRETLQEIERATGCRAKHVGKDAYATAQVKYNGCVFLAPSPGGGR